MPMNRELLIEKLIPKRSHTNSPIKIEIKKNKTLISWKNKGGGRHPRHVVLPRTICIDENTVALMGFFLGDGLKSSKGAASRTLSFTNSEPKTVLWAMKLFKIFEVSRNKIKASVSVYGNADKAIVKSYWNKLTKIPKENISVSVRPSLSTGKRNLPPIKKYGSIKLEFYSAILRDMAQALLLYSIKEAERTRNNAKAFLQGLAAAEGCPVINHGKLINVVISCYDERNKRIIRNLVKKCKLIHRIRSDGIELHANNFKNKVHRDIFSYHPERHSRFMLGLKSLKF